MAMTDAEKIYAVRNAKDLTMKEFAAMIHTSEGYVSTLESGKRTARESLVDLIIMKFDIARSWWNTGEGPMFREEKKQAPEIPEHLRCLFDEINRAFPDVYTLTRKYDTVAKVMRDLRED